VGDKMKEEETLSIQMLMSNILVRLTVVENLLKEKNVFTEQELNDKIKAMTDLLILSIENNIKNTPTPVEE